MRKIILTQKHLYSSIVLLTATIIIYWPVLQAQFLMLWDDQWMVMNYYTEAGFTKQNLWSVLTEFYHGQYAPVTELFYIALYALFGYNPFWFHLACLLVHLSNVFLIYMFINRLLLLTKSFKAISAQRIAFMTALLIAVHPFLVEAVAWISACKIILYVLFYLMALLSYLKYIESKSSIYFILTLFFFVVSFGAKEQAVIMPFSLLLIDYALKRDFKNYSVWLEKLPFFLLALFFGIITLLSQGPINFSENSGYPFYQRIAFACYSLTEYLVKTLIPVKLSYIYPFPNQAGESLSLRFWIYPIVVVFLTASLWSFWKRRWVFFGIAFFITHLVLALHIIPLSRFAIVADRYVYLAAVGVFFIIAYFLDIIITKKTKGFKFILTSCVIYVLAIGAYAHTRTKVWYDVDSLKMEIREQVKQRNDYEKLIKKMN